MSSETITPNDVIEPADQSFNEMQPTGRHKATRWIAGSLAVAAAGFVGWRYLDRETTPCESTIAIAGEASTTTAPLTLPDGRQVFFSVFSSPSKKKNGLPDVEVSVGAGLFDSTSKKIESFGKPGPEASFPVEKTHSLIVNATTESITTKCVAATNS
jgi:hypothetical protein